MDYNNIINFNCDRVETRRRAAIMASCLIENDLKGYGSRMPSDFNEPRKLWTKVDRVSKWEKRWTNLGSTFVRVYKWVKVEPPAEKKLQKKDKENCGGGQVAAVRGHELKVAAEKFGCSSLKIIENQGTGCLPAMDSLTERNGKLANGCEEKEMDINPKDTGKDNGCESVIILGDDSNVSDKDEDGNNKSEVDSLIDDPDDSSDGWNSAVDESKPSEDEVLGKKSKKKDDVC